MNNKGNKMLDAWEFIHPELIENADRPVMQNAKIIKLRLAASAVCATLAIMLLVAVPFMNTSTPAPLPHPWQTEEPPTSPHPLPTSPNTTIPPITPPVLTDTPTPPIDTVLPPEDEINYITIDINPSISVTITNGLISSFSGQNPDANSILKDIELNGLTVEDGMPIIIDALINNNYLINDNQNKSPVLLLSAHGNDSANAMLDWAADASAKKLKKNNATVFIIKQRVEKSEEATRIAAQYGISIGKSQYILGIIEHHPHLSFEKAAKMSMTELFTLDLDGKLSTPSDMIGSYDEYGERILIVTTQNMARVTVYWDELTEEEKKQLSDIYISTFPDETKLPFYTEIPRYDHPMYNKFEKEKFTE